MVAGSFDVSAAEQTVRERGFCVIPGVFPRTLLERWNVAFRPLLDAAIRAGDSRANRGPGRYYVTLPFTDPFLDHDIFDNDTIIEVVSRLIGVDGVFHQLATDTPVLGSEYQAVHRDARPLFPETGMETPPFQIAVNFPLVDQTEENGPFEIAAGTHMMRRDDAAAAVERGDIALEPVMMRCGDAMVRDVRALHRGTPNRTNEPRPMVVLGYSRRWLRRPEVSIRVPRFVEARLSDRAREWMRFEPRVDSLDEVDETERYEVFAY